MPGPQELDSSANEGSDDAPAAVVRIRGLPARAEIEPLLTHVSSAKPTKEKKIEQAFRQWAGARGHATSGTAHGGTDESADEVAPEPRGNGVQLTRAWAHFEILKASLAEMGLETTKEQPPSSALTLLGVEIY